MQLQINTKKKICLLGSYGVGKTSLVRRFVHNKFEDKYLSTIGVNISKKTITLKGNTPSDLAGEINLFIWDIANIVKFDAMVTNYLKGAHGAIFVTDLSRPNTNTQIKEYVKKFLDINPDAELILVGNKIDLVDKETIDRNDFLESMPEFKDNIFIASAKTGENVEELFNNLGYRLLKEFASE